MQSSDSGNWPIFLTQAGRLQIASFPHAIAHQLIEIPQSLLIFIQTYPPAPNLPHNPHALCKGTRCHDPGQRGKGRCFAGGLRKPVGGDEPLNKGARCGRSAASTALAEALSAQEHCTGCVAMSHTYQSHRQDHTPCFPEFFDNSQTGNRAWRWTRARRLATRLRSP